MALEHNGNRGPFYLEGGESSSSSHPSRVAQCRKLGGFLSSSTEKSRFEIESRCPQIRTRDLQYCRNYRVGSISRNAAGNRDRAHIRKDMRPEPRNIIRPREEKFQ